MVRQIIEQAKDQYTIIHCANASSMSQDFVRLCTSQADRVGNIEIEEVESLVSTHHPDILVSTLEAFEAQ